MKLIKIHGIQRSGTNYASEMIRKNFMNVWVSAGAGGSKHGEIRLLGSSLKKLTEADHDPERLQQAIALRDAGLAYFLVMMKDPFSWIVSYSSFKNRKITQANVVKWMVKYNHLNSHFLKMDQQHKNVLVTRYEDWVADYRAVLHTIQKSFKLQVHAPFQNHETIIRPNGRQSHRSFSREYYVCKLWRRSLTPQMRSWIKQNCCDQMLKLYNYA